jgi:ADP-ribosylglycohydrolase
LFCNLKGKESRMPYPKMPPLDELVREIGLQAQLKHEYGARGIPRVLRGAEKNLKAALVELKKLPVDRKRAKREPNDLEAIRALRPNGPRRLWPELDRAAYADRLEGALLARFAGCTLGAPVEGWPVEKMQALAEENGDEFPPSDYWSYVPEPKRTRYGVSPREAYTRKKMDGVPVDDDLAYTLLGLLIAEDSGPDFSLEDVGKAWLKYLPCACTAERAALDNLRDGVAARKAAEKDNPYCEWIGADIRSDPWGYLAPGWPEKAADMAWQDAYLSHRRQGIYGEMYFSAVIAAAFAVDDPVEALKLGLTEIPRRCALANALRWALRTAPDIKTYHDARSAADDKFAGMSRVHTINNACLTVWGLTLGGTDVTRVIGETVAMGLDNDCTAATAGSIVGAVVGRKGVPAKWTRPFGNTVRSYLIGRPRFTISGLVKRFTRQARRVHAEGRLS